jgi:hypothetical protein
MGIAHAALVRSVAVAAENATERPRSRQGSADAGTPAPIGQCMMRSPTMNPHARLRVPLTGHIGIRARKTTGHE